ncbi:MAG: hypothetical protein IJ131_00815 [Eggerthellaceae bacterium]|nr:hypothetical protein [Eggerthellaceae bacterium]
MTEASTNEQVLASTEAMIDGSKTVCVNAGLANDSSETRSLPRLSSTSSQSDKFLFELRKLDEFADCRNMREATHGI